MTSKSSQSSSDEMDPRADDPRALKVCWFSGTPTGCHNGSECPYAHLSPEEFNAYRRRKRAIAKASRKEAREKARQDWNKELVLPWTNSDALALAERKKQHPHGGAPRHYRWPLPPHQPLPCWNYANYNYCHSGDLCPHPHYHTVVPLAWQPVQFVH